MASDQQHLRKKKPPVKLNILPSKNPDQIQAKLPKKQWLTVAETAAVFGKTKVCIYDWIKHDIIPGIRMIKGIYYVPKKWTEPDMDD